MTILTVHLKTLLLLTALLPLPLGVAAGRVGTPIPARPDGGYPRGWHLSLEARRQADDPSSAGLASRTAADPWRMLTPREEEPAPLLTQKESKKRKARKSRSKQQSTPDRPQLNDDDQRRFDYFFLEAVRRGLTQEYDAAFDLLQHCLQIDTCASTALYELAQYYAMLKQNGRSRDALERAVRLAPDNYWYSQSLADFYLRTKDLEHATALLEDMTRRFPTRTDLLYSLMDLYNRQGDTDRVVDIVGRMEERMGKSEQLSMIKIRIYQQQKDSPHACQEVQSLIEEYPYEMRYPLMLADIYMQDGRTDEAYAICQDVLRQEPDNTTAMYSLAIYYQQTGQHEQYESQLDSLLLHPQVETATKVGIMRQIIIRSQQAPTPADSTRIVTLFDRMLGQDLEDTDLPMLYAQYLLSKEMNQEALPVLQRVIDLDPTYSGARMMLLGEAVGREDYPAIQALCEAGVEASPETLEFPFYLAICYNRDKRTDDVLRVCQQALTHVTRETQAELVSDFYNIMADAYHALGRDLEAFAAYDTAIVHYPDNYSALNNYAYYLSLAKRDLDHAEEMSYRTIKAEPHNATYLDTYAWVLFVKGNYAQARIYIDEALKNDDEVSADVLEHCGDIYYMTGDPTAALDYWQRAKAAGSESTTLDEKIKGKRYVPSP